MGILRHCRHRETVTALSRVRAKATTAGKSFVLALSNSGRAIDRQAAWTQSPKGQTCLVFILQNPKLREEYFLNERERTRRILRRNHLRSLGYDVR